MPSMTAERLTRRTKSGNPRSLRPRIGFGGSVEIRSALNDCAKKLKRKAATMHREVLIAFLKKQGFDPASYAGTCRAR